MGQAEVPGAPGWDELIAGVRSGTGSPERHDVGAFAMERVREVPGEDWPRRWVARHGRPPTFLADPSTDAVAYAELVETGLRLASCLLGAVPRNSDHRLAFLETL